MTFRQLEYIIEVADQGSISVAARKLMISQPSLSQSIKSIEKEYNITLFDRSAVPLVPTKAGSVFLNKAHIILTALEDLKQEIAQAETTPKELLIGISDSAALINKHIFRDFQAVYPDITLRLVERDQYLLERMLEAGKLDMIFTMTPYENPNIEVIPLVEDEFLIALPKTHPISQQCLAENPDMLAPNGKQTLFPSVDLSACKDVRYALSGRDRLKFAQLSALRSAFEPEISFETDTLASAVAIASHESHGTVVPKLFSTLYDGPDCPYFFRCRERMPTWRFALSLQKDYQLSDAGFQYIKLFIHYIDTLGLLSNALPADKLLERLRKHAQCPKPRRII